jgi:hypothetical protein
MYVLLNSSEEFEIRRNDLWPYNRYNNSDLESKIGIKFRGLNWPDEKSEILVVYEIVNERKFTIACIKKGISPTLANKDLLFRDGSLNQV